MFEVNNKDTRTTQLPVEFDQETLMFRLSIKALRLEDMNLAFAWIVKDFLNFCHEYLPSLVARGVL